MRHWRWMRARIAIAALLSCAVAGSARAATVEIVGLRVRDEVEVRELIGEPPDLEGLELESWGALAVRGVVADYVARGYPAARGWVRVDGDALTVEIDEGKVHRVAFRGANLLEKLLLNQAVLLPEGVLQTAVVDAQLEELRQSGALRAAGWTFYKGDAFVVTETNHVARELVLELEIDEGRQRGFGFDLDFHFRWGALVGPSYAQPDGGPKDAWWRVGATIGIPIQEYIWQADPQLSWRYGDIYLEAFGKAFGENEALAPLVLLRADLWQISRLDRDLQILMVQDSSLAVGFRIQIGPIYQYFAPAMSAHFVLRAIPIEGGDPTAWLGPDAQERALRFGMAGRTELRPSGGFIRSDLRHEIRATYLGMWAGNQGIFSANLEAQAAWPFSRFAILKLSGRGAVVSGDVRVYDEIRVAGKYQRTILGDTYYSEAVAQAGAELRFPLLSWVTLDGYYQQTVFLDRSDPAAAKTAWTNSFGPGVGVLLLGQVEVDAYVALGFAPPSYVDVWEHDVRFAQSLYLYLKSVY